MSKQKLDEVRKLAIKLFNARLKELLRQWPGVSFSKWNDLESDAIASWDAVAKCAIEQFGGRRRK